MYCDFCAWTICGSKKGDIQLEGTLTKYQSFRTVLKKIYHSPYLTGTSSGDEGFFSLILTSPMLTLLSVSINNDISYAQSKQTKMVAYKDVTSINIF